MKLTDQEIQKYDEDGFLVIRDVLSYEDIEVAQDAFFQKKRLWEENERFVYPQAGRYTLASDCLSSPPIAKIAENETIVACAEQLLKDRALLSACVVYNRTPGGVGIGPHNDYKRWRPAGSSMNWLFAILPFCDFDSERGVLYLSPGSHRRDVSRLTGSSVMDILPPISPIPSSFIDPEIRKGDLLLMSMYCWHRAGPNLSQSDRVGVFNKYCSASAPPATGHYVFEDDGYNSLSDAGKRLIACSGQGKIRMVRILLQRDEQILVRENGDSLVLPGGMCQPEGVIPDWDTDNYISSLYDALRQELQIELPWVTYIGDYDERHTVCRVYAHKFGPHRYDVPINGQWIEKHELAAKGKFGYEISALEEWVRDDVLRGKGITQKQGRINQYAY